MKKIELWYVVKDGQDGSAYPHFYLTEKDTENADDYDRVHYGISIILILISLLSIYY